MSGYVLAAALALVVFSGSVTDAAAGKMGKLSGYFVGDYYGVVSAEDEELKSMNGFWFRRVYFTYDKKLEEGFSVRLRLEMASPGDFTSSSKMVPFIKDGYLKWKRGPRSVYFGMSGTPTWGHVTEKFYGYRFLEKTGPDLWKLGSSRDFGLALKGAFDPDKKVTYHFMVGNGASTRSETDKRKKVYGSVAFKPARGVVIEGYGDFEARPDDRSRFTVRGFAGYKTRQYRFGGEVMQQTRRNSADDGDLTLLLLSVYGAGEVHEKAWIMARVDRMNNPNPSGSKISYLPLGAAVDSEATLVIAGIDLLPAKGVHIMPNIEAVVFDGAEGADEKPDPTIMPRVTLLYKF